MGGKERRKKKNKGKTDGTGLVRGHCHEICSSSVVYFISFFTLITMIIVIIIMNIKHCAMSWEYNDEKDI